MQSLFQQKVSLTLRLLIFSAIGIILMTLDHRDDTLSGVRSLIGSYMVYPLQYLVAMPANVVGWAGENLTERQALIERNEQLEQRNLQLRARQQRLASLQKENERLRDLLRASSRVGEDILIAEVLTIDQDYYKQQIVINKGESHDVYVGQPVIDATGVMGQVIERTRFSATVLLISDPGHALPVQNNRSGMRTIAQGKGNPNELDLLHIPNNTDIRAGDLMITSGLGGRFPANYPVAEVAKVEILPGEPFARVTATPMAQLDRSREVLLVWPGSEPES